MTSWNAGPENQYLPCGFTRALGTIGGGNHLAEVSRAARPTDPQTAAIGLGRDAVVVLMHSGSRALSTALADA